MTRTDSLGSTYDLTGFQAYLLINRNLHTYGAVAVSTAPPLSVVAGLLTMTLTLEEAIFSIAYTPTPLAAGNKALIFCTPSVSQGINRPAARSYRLIAVTAAAAASPADLLAPFTAKFGAPVLGSKVFVKARIMGPTGFVSEDLHASAIVN